MAEWVCLVDRLWLVASMFLPHSLSPGSINRLIMTKTFKIVLLGLVAFMANVCIQVRGEVYETVEMDLSGRQSTASTSAKFDWNPVMDAIIAVESGGDANAVSGNSCGAMQITPILVAECNDILRRRKSKKRFTLRDRFNVAKSKEMFLLLQSYFNPRNDIEKAIRTWNGGYNYSVKRTQRYFEKVMSHLK